jgi:hypothetical protein
MGIWIDPLGWRFWGIICGNERCLKESGVLGAGEEIGRR